jgi:hypothetical protein
MRDTINILQFSKGPQITCVAVTKGNPLTMEIQYKHTASRLPLVNFRKFILGG